MKEVITAIRNEVIALNELIASLNSEQWQSPTKFKDWTPEVIISHLYISYLTLLIKDQDLQCN